MDDVWKGALNSLLLFPAIGGGGGLLVGSSIPAGIPCGRYQKRNSIYLDMMKKSIVSDICVMYQYIIDEIYISMQMGFDFLP